MLEKVLRIYWLLCFGLQPKIRFRWLPRSFRIIIKFFIKWSSLLIGSEMWNNVFHLVIVISFENWIFWGSSHFVRRLLSQLHLWNILKNNLNYLEQIPKSSTVLFQWIILLWSTNGTLLNMFLVELKFDYLQFLLKFLLVSFSN